jgi:hypothetical protein
MADRDAQQGDKSVAWAAHTSSAVTMCAALALGVLGLAKEQGWMPWLALAAFLAAVGCASWLAVHWRFPLLSLLCLVLGCVFFESAAWLLFGSILFSQSLLARGRRFRAPGGRFNPHLAALCSGWLAAFSWGLAWLAEDTHRQQTPWAGPALAATAAAFCAVTAVLAKRRAPVATNTTASSALAGSLSASFAWGAGSLLLSVAAVVPLVVAIATGMAVGGSSSLTCTGDSCSYGSP